MKITLDNIYEVHGKIVVKFTSSIGFGSGMWVGAQRPEKMKNYDVELDVNRNLDEIATTTLRRDFHMQTEEGNAVTFSGVVETVDDDGMTYLRLAPDCLLMVESKNSSFAEGDWIQVKLSAYDLGVSAFSS